MNVIKLYTDLGTSLYINFSITLLSIYVKFETVRNLFLMIPFFLYYFYI